MFFIPGQVISLITFPGVIVHEFAHQFFCRLSRVAVFDVCYFRWGNPAGYVIHEIPASIWSQTLITVGPFVVNTLVGAAIALPASIPILFFSSGNWLDYVLIWLGVSIAMHAFPSTGDAKSLWKGVTRAGSVRWARFAIAPLVALIYVGAAGSVFWLDAVYGIAVATLLPNLIVKLIA